MPNSWHFILKSNQHVELKYAKMKHAMRVCLRSIIVHRYILMYPWTRNKKTWSKNGGCGGFKLSKNQCFFTIYNMKVTWLPVRLRARSAPERLPHLAKGLGDATLSDLDQMHVQDMRPSCHISYRKSHIYV